jgi:hypothetical protein
MAQDCERPIDGQWVDGLIRGYDREDAANGRSPYFDRVTFAMRVTCYGILNFQAVWNWGLDGVPAVLGTQVS